MATLVPEMPAEKPGGFAADLAGMGNFFIDPAGAAPRVFSKWFWVGPLVLFSVASILVSFALAPLIRHVLEIAPIPPNVTPEQYQTRVEMGLKIQSITVYLAPIFTAALFAIQSAILLGTASIMSVQTKFRWLFNLIAGCSLIQLLAFLAGFVIVKAKSDISTMAELRPALGLDIFLPEGTNKFLAAFLGFFSVFEIWWIVMLILILSTAFRVSKGKAVAVVLPLVVLSLLFRLGSAALSQ